MDPLPVFLFVRLYVCLNGWIPFPSSPPTRQRLLFFFLNMIEPEMLRFSTAVFITAAQSPRNTPVHPVPDGGQLFSKNRPPSQTPVQGRGFWIFFGGGGGAHIMGNFLRYHRAGLNWSNVEGKGSTQHGERKKVEYRAPAAQACITPFP